MTDLAPTPSLTPARTSQPVVSTLAVGVLGGCALGIIARVWMRLISDDPGFTWSGTVFIVIGFTAFGLGQSIVASARSRVGSRWKLTSLRIVGVVTMLPLFVGGGVVMFPTVVGGGLAVARTEWRAVTRVACLVVAAGPLLFVGHDLIGSFGWSVRSLAGFVLMLGIYATIVAATRFTLVAQRDGWRMSRRFRVVTVVGAAAWVSLLVVSSVGFG